MGVVLVVTMTCVPRFAVAQRITTPASLKEALEAESAHPLQELALMPHTWRIVAYQRREVDRSVPHLSVRKWLFRAYKSVGEDRVFHAFLKIAIRLGPSALRRLFTLTPGFVWFARALTRRNEAIDDNVRALTRRHDLFRHLEMEVLIPARHLSPALALIRDVITAFASDDPVSCENLALLQQAGLDRVLSHQRRLFPYFCHYPLAIRRIQRDDTLVSMASGQEPEWYSVSFFTYDTPKRTSFFAYYGFAQVMALALRRLFGGRPHWGKFFPLYHEDIAGLYEGLTSFRNICQRVDPVGVFQNAYTRRVLGFPDRSVPGANP
jgi:hypothetical protein